MNITYQELYNFIEQQPIINTHCHQDLSLESKPFTLDVLLQNSYATWCHVTWDSTPSSRAYFLKKVRFNSYFRWLDIALDKLYSLGGPLTAENWDALSDQIESTHRRPGYWLELLTKHCGYRKMIEDAYWNPGYDNGQPQLFTPAFRVNSFFFGYRPDGGDHDGNNALRLYRGSEPIASLDEYIAFIRQHILEKQRQGCVAMKLPIAYDRGLDFVETPKQVAQEAFERLKSGSRFEDVKAFQDYLLFEVCRIAAETGLPLQVHTGLGKIQRSNAMWLEEAIRKNPGTKFILLHCSIPWIEDTLALMRTFPNVYPDLSWLPNFSTELSVRMLHNLIEGGMAHRVCWGCDTWTPEESYASLLVFRHVLARALAEKVEQEYLSLSDAKGIASNILYRNGSELYRIG